MLINAPFTVQNPGIAPAPLPSSFPGSAPVANLQNLEEIIKMLSFSVVFMYGNNFKRCANHSPIPTLELVTRIESYIVY